MFNTSFKEIVQKQLTDRQTLNSAVNGVAGQEKKFNNWLNKTPFILAYSNVRFANDDSFKEYGILGSTQINQINKKHTKFTDFYEINPDFGIQSKPVIKNFEIRGRGSHGTLRNVTLTIQCFNYEQFQNIKKYFSTITTTVFIQYGYYRNEESFSNTILSPIYDEKKIGNKNNYLNDDYVNNKYDKTVDMQCISGAVYDFSIDQSGINFTLTVELMTTNSSQITNVIKFKKLFNDRVRFNNQSMAESLIIEYEGVSYYRSHYFGNNNEQPKDNQIDSKWVENNLIDKVGKKFNSVEKIYAHDGFLIKAVSAKPLPGFFSWFPDEKVATIDKWVVYYNPKNGYSKNLTDYLNGLHNTAWSQIVNINKKRTNKFSSFTQTPNRNVFKQTQANINYVSLNWIIGNIIEKIYISQTGSDKLINFIIKPEFGYTAQYLSNTSNVTLIVDKFYKHDNTTLFPKLMNAIIPKRYSNMPVSELQEVIYQYGYIGWSFTEKNTNKVPIDMIKSVYKEYIDNYDWKGSSDRRFAWFGNIYFDLKVVIDYMTQNPQSTINGLLTYLFGLVKNATNGKIDLMYSYNEKNKIYQIQQVNLNYVHYDESYFKINNFGHKSIMRDVVYNFTIPDGYKVSMLQVYSGVQTSNIFKAIFGDDKKPYDISKLTTKLKTLDVPKYAEREDEFKVDDSFNLKTIHKQFNDINFGIIFQKNHFDETQKYDWYNDQEYVTQTNKIKKVYKNNTLSSIYHITVQFTLDFIANISWGQVFKLYFNPLGWQCKFYVKDVKQRVDEDRAETTITGFMIG